MASAYSLDDYRIAADLGGDAAHANLRDRAAARGIRLASDMVPNHMGIDSRWVIDHPDRFIWVPEPPFPAYTYTGDNLADDDRVEIRLEDHYWNDTDAAVVFERRDRATGDVRYVYHGNDGTSFPWNDTAQLDYLKADVREAVIQTILEVARRFPVIRFDAAMVLAKRHIERLWWPEPGQGGAIPSRSHYAMTKAAFDALMPDEFWREVVDRVAAEAPDTLLLAEAFWMMEGYFVRTLGMHRVYNSAFMHMLRDEDNAGYRKVIRDTLEFDPEIIKRYVNFMTNPDEETAIEQFGTGDKYFGVATLLATLPGLPMIGHGQIEGFGEKYGMEFRRARLDEQPNEELIARFEREIVPLLHERAALRRRRRLPPLRRHGRRRGDRRRRLRLLERARAGSLARRLSQPVRDGRGLDPGCRCRSLARPATGRRRSRPPRSPGHSRSRATPTSSSPSGRRAPASSTCDPPGRWSSAGSSWSSTPTAASSSARSGSSATRRRSAGQSWRRDSAGTGVPSLDDALADVRLAPVHGAVAALLAPDLEPAEVARRRAVLMERAGLPAEAAATTVRRGATPTPPPSDLDPAARAAALLRPIDRAQFDELRLGKALRAIGFDAWAVARIRIALGLARPSQVRDPARLAAAWLDDHEIRAFLGVNTWEGVEWFSKESFETLLDLAVALDRADGVSRTSPAVGKLRRAAEAAGYRVDQFLAALQAPAKAV